MRLIEVKALPPKRRRDPEAYRAPAPYRDLLREFIAEGYERAEVTYTPQESDRATLRAGLTAEVRGGFKGLKIETRGDRVFILTAQAARGTLVFPWEGGSL